MVHSRERASSTNENGFPCRRSRRDVDVSVVSSWSSRHAAQRGDASEVSTDPEMGASLCLGGVNNINSALMRGRYRLLVCADVGAATEECDARWRGGLGGEAFEDEGGDDAPAS